MVDAFSDGIRIAYGDAVEAPFIPQNTPQQPLVHGAPHAVQIVECRHDRTRSDIDAGFVGWQILFPQTLHGHIHLVVILAGFSGPVSRKVLQAGCHRIRLRQVPALKSHHFGRTIVAVQQGVLAGSLTDTSPAGIFRDVNHRGERHVNARRCRFFRRHSGRFLPQFGFPRATFSQRDRRHGPKSMDHIIAEQQGNPQAAFFDGDFLEPISCSRIPDAIVRTNFSGTKIIFMEIFFGGAHQSAEFFLTDPAIEHHIQQFLEADLEGTD
ncbi:hypothetical protein SDC9_52359 [bioreactor metagenome]|uniref:Uncharacterized protein n=1 Tax=bioreactor metagenome TaxID=1076179 RepID=A0A644WVH1_9ZZZZ